MLIEMPEIVGYSEISKLLKRSPQTVYTYVCYKKFPRGVYIGGGRFNLTRLLACMEAGELFKPAKKASKV